MNINKHGFTIIEVLVAISIVFLISPLFFSALKFMQNYPVNFTVRQNNLGIIQLRRSLSLGTNHKVEYDSICMNFKGELMCFEHDETSLIAYPGTQFFLVNIDSLNFELIDGWITLFYNSENVEYHFRLIKL